MGGGGEAPATAVIHFGAVRIRGGSWCVGGFRIQCGLGWLAGWLAGWLFYIVF